MQLLPANLSVDRDFDQKSTEFLNKLAREQGVVEKKTWRNNNSTLQQHAYIIDVRNYNEIPGEIFRRLYEFNRKSGGPPLVAVPVAGWETIESTRNSCLPCFSRLAREQRLVSEYAQSFSLAELTTAKNADVILRVSKAVQRMEVFKRGNAYFLSVSPGVRITDADEFLLKKGFALPPNMPTLHVASLVGAAANGCYGPGRDYGPMTTNIAEMKVINALGQKLILSNHENQDLFSVLRDCHIAAGCFVSELTLQNIEPKFRMKRHSILYKDVDELKMAMQAANPISREHFIAMYIPVDIQEKGDHCPRIRITTYERTNEKPSEEFKCREQRDLCDYINLITTEVGEPLINQVVESEALRQFFPFILKTAALKTYGTDKETVEVDWSASIAHIFRTYTDLPICDINWLIQVDSMEKARDLLAELLELTELMLKKYAESEQYPLFNAFARYLKGVYYPEGQGGITPTAVDRENQSILSFEYVTYAPLADTAAFKNLVNTTVQFLRDKGLKFNYHPGKNLPENVRSLSQLFTDEIGKKRLENFKKAVFKLHGGMENVLYSPLLTSQKKELLGLESIVEPKEKRTLLHLTSKNQERQALERILQLAEEAQNRAIVDKARSQLRS